MKKLTAIIIIATAALLCSAGTTNLYRLEAKRKLLKSSAKECQIAADSLRTLLLQTEMQEADITIESDNEIDLRRHNLTGMKRRGKEINSSRSAIIITLDSLEILIKKYSDEDKAISDSIKAYLRGKQ